MSVDRSDLAEKLARLAGVATRHGGTQLVLREPATLTWLLDARVHVPQTLDTACLDVVVDLDGGQRLTVVTNAIEAPRLRDTELADLPAEWLVVPWWESRDGVLPHGPTVGSDRPLGDSVPVGPDLARVRRILTSRQQTRLHAVCADAAAAATATSGRIEPGTSEYAAAGLLAAELMARELDPVVLLVGGDERIGPHRHPLPTARPVGRRAMLVCCARRHGLIASVTRIVSFGALGDAEQDTYARLLQVEQAFLDATAAGVPIGETVDAGTAAYAANGFDADEWQRHHQGGFSGFQPREYPAHHRSGDIVEEGAVVAWNPSGGGWKVEDTCLVGAAGPEPLVDDGAWPMVAVGGRSRPGLLAR